MNEDINMWRAYRERRLIAQGYTSKDVMDRVNLDLMGTIIVGPGKIPSFKLTEERVSDKI